MGTSESPYIASLREYRNVLKNALAIADDVFKAPEQVVETAPAVVRAALDVQVQFAAMIQNGKR